MTISLSRIRRSDIERSVISLLLMCGVVVGLLVRHEVRELKGATAAINVNAIDDAKALDLVSDSFDAVSKQNSALLQRLEDSAAANLESIGLVREEQAAMKRDIADLRSQIQAQIKIEEAHRETQLRFTRWLDEAAKSIVPEDAKVEQVPP